MIAPAVWILINLVTKPRPLIKLGREIAIIYGIVYIFYFEQSSAYEKGGIPDWAWWRQEPATPNFCCS